MAAGGAVSDSDGPFPLEQYVHDCRRLAQDLEDTLADIEDRLDGGEIRYAIDFAEVHAYVDPEPAEATELRVFADDDIATCWAIQNAVVNLLLFGLDSKPILLPPYAVELEGYLNWSETQPARVLARSLAKAFDEASKIRNSDESDAIVGIASTLRETPEAVGDEDRNRVFRYVEEHAKNLAVLVQAGQARPRYALIELLRRRPFADLSSLGALALPLQQDALPLNEKTAERWEEELLRRRPRSGSGANQRDAYVMMLLEAVDTTLWKSKTNSKLCLVTRSPHMHEFYEQELAEQRWAGSSRRLLRHPRSFIAAAAGSLEELRAIRKRLQNQRTSILTFLDMMGQPEDVGPDQAGPAEQTLHVLARESRERARERLEAIKGEWRQLVSLATAEAGAHGVVPQTETARSPRQDVVLEVFRAVHDPGVLQAHVRDRIDELARTINFHYQYVTALEGRVSSGEAIAEDVKAAVVSDAVTIDATFVPYALAFRSPEVMAWSKRLSRERRVDPDQLLEMFEQGFSSGRTYEPLLALAYLFAAWDRWTVARDYADLALAARVDSDPPPTEGLLLRALCLRMVDAVSRANYEEAMRLLDTATALTDDGDPRVLAEKSVQVFYWSSRFDSAQAKAEEALAWSERAIALLQNRGDEEAIGLQIRVLNNLCFYFLQFDDEQSRAQATKALGQLIDIQQSREPDRAGWRPAILDTILWAEWRLEGSCLSNEARDQLRNRLIEQYEDLLRRSISSSTRASISHHLRALREATVPA